MNTDRRASNRVGHARQGGLGVSLLSAPMIPPAPAGPIIGEDLADWIDWERVYVLASAARAGLDPADLAERTRVAKRLGRGNGALIDEGGRWYRIEWPDGRFLCRVHRSEVTR